ncbi:MAG TPA: hypothetical protein VFX28_10675 [Methylomirabilota bacterium]|nr:hypothetical protein [Methylomirabilota bacterium]
MPHRLALFWLVATATPSLTPQRAWLERLALIVPGPDASRWLLVADAACLIALALASRRPRIAVPLALGVGFLGVNVAGMLLTDFYLGLAVVHLTAGSAALLFARRWRWVGAGALGLALALGVLT